MFDSKDSINFETEEEDFDTVMASDITFSGTIKFCKPFMIKGKMNGNIEATSDLLIDTDAEVNADIVADRVLVRGKTKGNIIGKKLVYVTSTGSVTGDIVSSQVVLEPGSSFSGKCSMTQIEAAE
ncbi:MAG: polymer-forming cytoskeletal protein [Treponema sp.]|nr:polymer-forming cytoskeletal protein [Spirochaetia bacterium]MDD7015084.1 polymer-forming cytoskeletal protein [Spirochaetales bacterium]MDY4902696.1 polymer-forming cytoskeletal protein [Treponema sp.]